MADKREDAPNANRKSKYDRASGLIKEGAFPPTPL
jgi:hypothetical protein